MADFQIFLEGFVIMVATVIIGTALSYAGGYIIDNTYAYANDHGMLDESNPYTYEGAIFPPINLFFVMCYVISFLGVAIFYLSTIKKQQYDEILGRPP